MKRQIRGAAFAAAPFLFAPAAHAQSSSDYTAPRNASVDAAGARTVEVEAAAGSLRVEGKAGLRQVQVTGTARSSSQQFLNQIRLIAERRGDVVFIKADIPDRDWDRGYRDNSSAALDLVILVPQGINADVSDGSGEAKILNVGSLEASDGSGDFSVVGAAGTVRITDGSGNLTIENVGERPERVASDCSMPRHIPDQSHNDARRCQHHGVERPRDAPRAGSGARIYRDSIDDGCGHETNLR